MIHSMTGYGRAQQSLNGRDILVEIKAVNHRYFEFSSRIPRRAASSQNFLGEIPYSWQKAR